jgi:hypothetical protein
MNRAASVFTAAFCVLYTSVVLASGHGAHVPEYVPYCSAPQMTAPLQAAGGERIALDGPVVWNGRDYAMAWVDHADNHVHFRRFFADGTPASAVMSPSSLWAVYNDFVGLVWNGSGYGLVWAALSPDLHYQVYLARLDVGGNLVGSELKASFVGVTETADCSTPALAWSGAGYLLAWRDRRYGTDDLFATLVNADGTIANGGASHDLLLCGAANDQMAPRLAWSSGANVYKAVWMDKRNGVQWNTWGATVSPAGAITPDAGALVSTGSNSYVGSLADNGNGLGMVWSDDRDGNREIYFARLSASGAKLGSDLRLTNDGAASVAAYVVWTGAEYAVFWMDNRSGNNDTWFQRVSAAGLAVGTNTQVTVTSDMEYPLAAFARYGFLVGGNADSQANFVQAWGCASDVTPPTCPGGFVAYNITGTTATLGWLPSGDPETDVAYYLVYRDAVPIAKTSDTYYADSGLSVGTTYAYSVEPVNAAQLQNYSCQTVFYVKSNATLALMLNKTDTLAHLTWGDISLGTYNVFRGTSPQVMQQVGSTSACEFDDSDVLHDNVLYFYSVDEPGW